MTSVLDLITDSLQEIGAIAIGESVPAAESSGALRALQQLAAHWSTEELMIYNTPANVFPLVANQITYTCGTGGNFNIARPMYIQEAYIRDVNNIDYPVYVTDNFSEYAEILKKDITSPIPFILYDNGDIPLKVLSFYPVPTSAAYSVVLWTTGAISFTNLTDTITLPPAYERAMRLNLAIELSPRYGKPVTQELSALAIEAKAQVKRNNTVINQLIMPSGISSGRRYSYTLQDFYAGR